MCGFLRMFVRDFCWRKCLFNDAAWLLRYQIESKLDIYKRLLCPEGASIPVRSRGIQFDVS